MDLETPRNSGTGRLSSAAEILRCRAAFSAYNVSRVRELIRGLSPGKYRLFQQIPLWLHMNRPRTPGFVADPRVPFGIYRFQETGFWRQALSNLKLSEKKLRPFLPARQPIQGLYLMGSSGTLAQTDASDFDYWVVIRREEMGPAGWALLGRKLNSIEVHCRERYGQAVTFFILDEGQVRANAFDVMDEESSGSAQKTLLKDEFYRTFIMIAGRIPFWAVLPPGLDDRLYRRRIDAALKERHLRFLPEDYIDLGNLAVLDRDESLGAILWQIFKSRHSPAKSFLKAALIAQYFFSRDDGFLCDTVKARFLEGATSDSLLDPYAQVFEKALSFFGDLEDREGLALLKTCIYLRLSGERPLLPAAGGSPREALLDRYIRQWGWDERQIRRVSHYRQWPEAEKLDFDRAVFDKLSFLYELVLRGKDRADAAVRMTDRDLAVLTNRIAGYFRQEPGKIPRCSSHAGRNKSAIQFVVAGRCGEDGLTVWRVFGDETHRSVSREALFFNGPELLKTAGWLVLNGLFSGGDPGITFQAERLCEATGSQARRFVQRIHKFFTGGAAGPEAVLKPPTWTGVVVCLHRSEGGKGARWVRADFLSLNTWGEFFFETLALAHAKTEAAACYDIAEHLWLYLKDAPSFDLPFRLVCPDGGGGAVAAEKDVGRYIEKFIENALQLRSSKNASEGDPGDGPDNPLILDR
jgi:adenylate cyclase class 1